jgi:hypothetical protein
LRKSLLLRCPAALLAAALLFAPAAAQAPTHPAPLHLTQPVLDKNFYLFSALGRSDAARRALAADPRIAQIVTARRNDIAAAVKRCKGDVVCQLKTIAFTSEDILAVSLALRNLGDADPALKAVVDNDIRPAGVYPLFASLASGELLARAWELCANGVNHIIDVYGEGAAPRYPEIDSISFDMKSDEAKERIATVISAGLTADAAHSVYDLPLQTALLLLALNHRDEAGRHEPMEAGENKAAIAAIAETKWQAYPYTVIVVPGLGPNDPQTRLTGGGRRRDALAAAAYRAHKAPFILVSGGYVHPSQTRYSEAIEMKRSLMADEHLPDSAIIVDPHASHTTTNMRNAVREIYRYGIPIEKPALVISEAGQIASISAPPGDARGQLDRSLREFGYLPYRIVSKNSPTESAFLPLIDSLQQDPIEPLDP